MPKSKSNLKSTRASAFNCLHTLTKLIWKRGLRKTLKILHVGQSGYTGFACVIGTQMTQINYDLKGTGMIYSQAVPVRQTGEFKIRKHL